MKKIVCFCVVIMSMALIGACGKAEKKEAAKDSKSENFRKAEQCVRNYEKGIRDAKSCKDLEVALGRYYDEQTHIGVPNAEEREELKKLVSEAEKSFLEKFNSLDCASEPEEEEE